MSVSVWIREQLGCKDEYKFPPVCCRPAYSIGNAISRSLFTFSNDRRLYCMFSIFIKHLHFMLVRLKLFKKIANFVFHNAKKMQKRAGKVDTYAPMSGCFFPLIRSTRHAFVGGGLNGRFGMVILDVERCCSCVTEDVYQFIYA